MTPQPKQPAANPPLSDATWRAMQIVRHQWHCAGCIQVLKGKAE